MVRKKFFVILYFLFVLKILSTLSTEIEGNFGLPKCKNVCPAVALCEKNECYCESGFSLDNCKSKSINETIVLDNWYGSIEIDSESPVFQKWRIVVPQGKHIAIWFEKFYLKPGLAVCSCSRSSSLTIDNRIFCGKFPAVIQPLIINKNTVEVMLDAWDTIKITLVYSEIDKLPKIFGNKISENINDWSSSRRLDLTIDDNLRIPYDANILKWILFVKLPSDVEALSEFKLGIFRKVGNTYKIIGLTSLDLTKLYNGYFNDFLFKNGTLIAVKKDDYIGWVSKHSSVPMATARPHSCPNGNIRVIGIEKNQINEGYIPIKDENRYMGRSSVAVYFSDISENEKSIKHCTMEKNNLQGVFYNKYFPENDNQECHIILNNRQGWTGITPIISIKNPYWDLNVYKEIGQTIVNINKTLEYTLPTGVAATRVMIAYSNYGCGSKIKAVSGDLNTIKFPTRSCSWEIISSTSNEIIYFYIKNLKFPTNKHCSNYMQLDDCTYQPAKLLYKLCNKIKNSDFFIVSTSGSKLCVKIVKENAMTEEPTFLASFYSKIPNYDTREESISLRGNTSMMFTTQAYSRRIWKFIGTKPIKLEITANLEARGFDRRPLQILISAKNDLRIYISEFRTCLEDDRNREINIEISNGTEILWTKSLTLSRDGCVKISNISIATQRSKLKLISSNGNVRYLIFYSSTKKRLTEDREDFFPIEEYGYSYGPVVAAEGFSSYVESNTTILDLLSYCKKNGMQPASLKNDKTLREFGKYLLLSGYHSYIIGAVKNQGVTSFIWLKNNEIVKQSDIGSKNYKLFEKVTIANQLCVVWKKNSDLELIDCSKTVSKYKYSPLCEKDIDECRKQPCGAESSCFNTIGGYNCNCKKGYFTINKEEDCKNLCKFNLGSNWSLYKGKCVIQYSSLMSYYEAVQRCKLDNLKNENTPCFNCSNLIQPICSKGNVDDENIRGFIVKKLEKSFIRSSISKVTVSKGKYIRIRVIKFNTEFKHDQSVALKIVEENPEELIAHVISVDSENTTILTMSNFVTIRIYFTERSTIIEKAVLARGFVTYEEVECGLGKDCPESSNCGSIGEITNFDSYTINYTREASAWKQYKYCLWRFKVKQGRYIKILPIEIDMKSSLSKCTQYTDIYDGPYIKTVKRKMRVCEDKMPRFVSSSNTITIVMILKPLESRVHAGEHLVLQLEEEECPGCVMSSDSCAFQAECRSECGQIMSPGYPLNFPPGLICHWTIFSEPRHYIEIEIMDFDVPSSDSNCKENSLTLIHDNGGYGNVPSKFEKYCDKKSSKLFESDGEIATIVFQSDFYSQGNGFNLKYRMKKFPAKETANSTESSLCQSNWFYYKGNCYKYFKESSLTWLEANTFCMAQSSNLVSILDSKEMDVVMNWLLYVWMKNSTEKPSVYLGLNVAPNKERWTDYSPMSYTDWSCREPSDPKIEHCTLFSVEGYKSSEHWFNRPCAHKATDKIICKRPATNFESFKTPAKLSQYPCSLGWFYNSTLKSCISLNFLCLKSQKIYFNIENSITGNETSTVNKPDVCIKDVLLENNTCNEKIEFQCTDGSCILINYKCDRIKHCTDGSDEQNCTFSEEVEYLWTTYDCSGTNRSISELCDHSQHCPTGSDEKNCDYPNCPSDSFECYDKQCIDKKYQCDGYQHCSQNADEKDCSNYYPRKTFTCYEGTIIPNSRVNDGQTDCQSPEKEDESQIDKHHKKSCNIGEFKCKNGACINFINICIMDKDPWGYYTGCRDQSHLRNCEYFICPKDYIKCPHSYCIPLNMRCNGKYDCPRGEDEMDCYTPTCPGHLKCSESKLCVQSNKRCDGYKDCPNGDDEQFCDLTTCPQNCVCNGYIVECTNQGLTSIPEGLSKKARMFILSNNNITEIPAGSLDYLYNIRRLDLSYNSLRTFNGLFKNLISIEELILVKCGTIDVLPDEIFSGLVNLKILNLGGLGIRKIFQESFHGLSSVRLINITDNPIPSFEHFLFDGLDQLTRVESSNYAFCCIFGQEKNSSKSCLPKKDALSSCADLMERDILRAFLWILGVLALVGNAFVIIWRCLKKENSRSAIHTFLITNLGLADFLMSIYLLIVAGVDAYYRGDYIENAHVWKSSALCKLCGVLSTTSSQLSVFALTTITLDRFSCIVYPFSGKKLGKRSSRVVIIFEWILAITLAVIPLFPSDYFQDNFYSRSSVCLPLYLTGDKRFGWEYSFAIFVFLNGISFVVIAIAYTVMFSVVVKTRKAAGKDSDISIARKMAFIVVSDMLCWMPVAIMGILAMWGGVTIPGELYAWTAVCILPINSAINPILYTISNINFKEIIYTSILSNDSQDSQAKADKITLYSNLSNSDRIQSFDIKKFLKFLSDCSKKQIMISGSTFGCSLEQCLRRGDSFTADNIFYFMLDLCKALTYLHSLNVAHREVSKEKIVLSNEKGRIRAYLLGLGKMAPRSSNDKTGVLQSEDIKDLGLLGEKLLGHS
ncbi:DgyrCDS14324 [Dimorphilus gyrociliatus]|uniref:DgyrCDS14324 n=1 Tax=Dimorphilus gyrociliatus TaxID=2664684 RepID=A0A7I8WDN3_9ANNE|nr:DgyrCDS14324 [Dimorphilus gyrociliatus]